MYLVHYYILKVTLYPFKFVNFQLYILNADIVSTVSIFYIVIKDEVI